MVKVTSILHNSLAAHAGIRAGDILLSINQNAIRDVLDYRFYLTDTAVSLVLQREQEEYTVHINKGEYDDIGLEFETPLMDQKHSCTNKCVFCFIDQLPPGMRDTLYFKDDDDRLSFLHGNYITMTNLSDADIDRIIKMHISPVNISVHTTNPELRVKMMKNKHAGRVLSYLQRLSDAGIALCTQIVLCKGLNDGKELTRTMHDLAAYYPALRSCAIVPVGLTKYRDKLEPLEPFSPDAAADVIRQVETFGEQCLAAYGSRLFFCADEFYIRAGLPLPKEEHYEGYPQIENGVGMLTSLETEFNFELSYLDELLSDFKAPRTVSVATGAAAYGLIKRLSDQLCKQVPDLTVHVYRIKNRFFGESVTVAGLLTGKDLAEQLDGKALGDELLFSASMLRADGEVFLDDMTPDELSNRLQVPVSPVKSDGRALICALLGLSDAL